MPKVNRIFLALIIALLITAVAETFFIFVYKPGPSFPNLTNTPTNPAPTPTPYLGNSAINSKFFSFLGTWTQMPNEEVTVTQVMQGTIGEIDKKNTLMRINFAKQGNNIGFTFIKIGYNPNKLLVFLQLKNGNTSPISFDNLAVGDNIRFQTEYDAQKTPEENPSAYIIYKLQ
jgi:hypothetical protein